MKTAIAYAATAALLLGIAGAAAAQVGPPRPAQAGVSAKAAPPAKPKPEPMKVRIVRSTEPGCEPTCAEWISAQGEIGEATPAQFRRALSRLGDRKLPILIDSAGGAVDPSMAIGRMIRAKGLDVVVTRTILAPPCRPHDADCRKLAARGVTAGRAEAKISKCASSCAFILAGGVRRYVGVWTIVGLHEIKAISTRRLIRQHYRILPGSPVTGAPARKQVLRQEVLRVDRKEGPAGEKTYDRIRSYFVEMGVAESIMPILRAAPHSSIRWVRLAELKATRLATDFMNGEQLMARPTAASPISTAPAPPGASSAGAATPATSDTAPSSVPAIRPIPTAATPTAPAVPTAAIARPTKAVHRAPPKPRSRPTRTKRAEQSQPTPFFQN